MLIEAIKEQRLKELHDMPLLPELHVNYLKRLDCTPKVIYDIGSAVLHWTNVAKNIWPYSKFILFEAMDEVEFLYKDYDYNLGVLSNIEKEVEFYQRPMDPGGNSYYKEVGNFFTENDKVKKRTFRLDDVVINRGYPLPDFIKMDVQGAELDILKGADKCLDYAKDLILELQHKEYNIGAPQKETVIEYLNNKGFYLINNFISTEVDGDYHFRKK